ncbi:hypothetical protein GW901_00485 [Candidatus Parcubacteria bacterium]|nr:hypothetical protein [Candidatus Parcubacteria bacterium]
MTENKSKPKCRKKDLISLVWPVNIRCSTLIAGVPKGVTIDTVAGTWTFEGQTYQIGGNGRYNAIPWIDSPIGVYDRTKMKHLDQMHSDIIWVERRNVPAVD